MRARLAVLSALLAAPTLAWAGPESTAACHCFTNRTFDPAQPAAADPYVLATTRSSLLSAAYGVGKAGLVQEVMTGTDPEDLWVAYWAGARTGKGAQALLAEKARLGSWKAAFGKAGAPGTGPAFQQALSRGGDASRLAAIAVDDVLATRMAVEPATLAALRQARATNAEVVLATLLAPRLRVPATELLERFRSGKATWGMLLDEAGLKPKQIDGAIRQGMR